MSNFGEISSRIYQQIMLVDDVKSNEFKHLLIADVNLRQDFYDYFSLSGASLVLADSLNKRVVLLQDHIEAARGIPKIDMPVYEGDARRDKYLDTTGFRAQDYNYLNNRIFQIQREHQGMKDHEDDVTFKDVPEFLQMIHSMDRTYDSAFPSYKQINSHEYMYGFLIWRFLIWKSHDRREFDLRKFNAAELSGTGHSITPGDNYFSQINAKDKFQANKENKFRELPEYSIFCMGQTENWNLDYRCVQLAWKDFRIKIDSVKKDFNKELDILSLLSSPELIKELKSFIGSNLQSDDLTPELMLEVLAHFLNVSDYQGTQTSILNLIAKLHTQIPLIIPYYYFSLIDERIKSHFVCSIWHSSFHPIEYFDELDELKTHTSVFSCVVSLNKPLSDDHQIELVAIMKIISERIINSVVVDHQVRAEQRKDTFQFERNVLLSKAMSESGEDSGGVFILGINEQRVTFAAQQARAMNLIRSLSQLNIIKQESRIAILGGGLSGITAAMAASVVGVEKIHLFEKSEEILTLQGKSEHRIIHPTIYDFPRTIYEHNETNFPFLNWKANTAPVILEGIKNEFDEFQDKLVTKIRIHVDSEVNEIVSQGQKYLIKLDKKNYSPAEFKRGFDIVILATGQGKEKDKFDLGDNFLSYWDLDKLDELNEDDRHRILIAGVGDGALADLVRAKLTINQHGIFDLTTNKIIRKLSHIMLEADRSYLVEKHLNGSTTSLYNYYRSHGLSLDLELVKSAISILSSKYRQNVHIVHYYNNNQLKDDTSLINRLLAYLLHIDKNSSVFWESEEIFKINYQEAENNYLVTHKGTPDVETFEYVFPRCGLDEEMPIKNFKFNKQSTGSNVAFQLNVTNQVSYDTTQWYCEKLIEKYSSHG
jgi:threonine dehydrogenase-like Zn-dependent dehydrogenase